MEETTVNFWKGAPPRKSKSAVADCLRWNKKPWICNRCGAAATEEYAQALEECPACPFPTGNLGAPSTFHRRRLLVMSLGDILDPQAPIEWFAQGLDTIRKCNQMNFLLPSKWPQLWRSRMSSALDFAKSNGSEELCHFLRCWDNGSPENGFIIPQNIWFGVSVENQQCVNERSPLLLKIPAKIRFLSVEPLLGPVELPQPMDGEEKHWLDWVIVGGESGPGARPCNVEWIQSIIRQCKEAGIPCFVKQPGSSPRCDLRQPIGEWPLGVQFPNTPHVNDKKGGDPLEWPEDLRIQQFPNRK